MREKTLQRKLYDYFTEHWFISAVISTIPTFWFAFVQIFGPSFGLVAPDGKLSAMALYVLWPLFAISLVFSFLKAWNDKQDNEVKRNGQFVLNRMLQSVNSIKQKKVRRFISYIEKSRGKKGLNPFHDITQPKAQIESILENIQGTLSEIFDISRDDIGLSIIYKTDQGGNWTWLYTLNVENDLSLEELINNSHTTAKQIIDGEASSLFFPDKRIGMQMQQYVAGRKDLANNNIGSVLCRDISIDAKYKYVQAVLSITTYGKQLCSDQDQDSIYKIERILLPSFEYRLQLELSLLYIIEVLS